MRFAEDMLLNAKFYKLGAYLRINERTGSRCALGLVDNGNGNAEKNYPWLVSITAPVPCEHNLYSCGYPPAIIAHLFNEHVMQGGGRVEGFLAEILCHSHPNSKPWTLEQLADWIDSIDPTPRSERSPEFQFLEVEREQELECVK